MKLVLFTLFHCFFLVYSPLVAQENKIVFAPHWLPQAQFAGYYVALDQGFFEKYGLDVEIIHPSATTNVIDFLNDGRAHVVTQFLVSALYAKDKNTDIVNIAQYSQRSAIMLVSKKSSGIERLESIQGKRIGVWRGGFSEIPRAMVQGKGLQVEWVPILSSVNLFLMNGIDLMTVMWYNEYNQIRLSGVDSTDLNTFFLSEYGYDIPEDGLYTLRSTRMARSEQLSAFVQATNDGWEFASKNREYTIDLVVGKMREANISSNRAHQGWMLDRILELQEPTQDKNGKHELNRDAYRATMSILRDNGFVKTDINFDTFFLPVIHRQK
jgi:NitT/TauT family transport system substrate-binding protein